MKRIITIFLLTFTLLSFRTDETTFVGKILYKYSFSDLKGNDITEKVAPYLGREQHYFIDGKNYKAYDENNKWMQLYNSETNNYYSFDKEQGAQLIDGSTQTSQKFKVTKLDRKEMVAGYACDIIQIDTDNSTTVYYYNKTIKTDPKVFSKHNFGDWNKYLEATDGALSLKFVTTNRQYGYNWSCVATEVSKQDLTAKDFMLPSDIKIKN